MPKGPSINNFNDTLPAAPAGFQNVKWQLGPSTGNDPVYTYPIYPVSAYVPVGAGGVLVKTASYPAVVADGGKLISFNSADAVTLTLPSSGIGTGWMITVQNVGAGDLTIGRNGLLIDVAAADITLYTRWGVAIYSDGTNYFTVRGMQGPGLVLVAQ
jgi:hypothetical protein